jgi:uncharacterized low-complexity protein
MTNKALAAALIGLLAVSSASGALAQSAPAKPAGMVVQSGEPKATKTAAASGRKAPTKMNEDARHCLDLPSTAEIVKCAEPYRY